MYVCVDECLRVVRKKSKERQTNIKKLTIKGKIHKLDFIKIKKFCERASHRPREDICGKELDSCKPIRKK